MYIVPYTNSYIVGDCLNRNPRLWKKIIPIDIWFKRIVYKISHNYIYTCTEGRGLEAAHAPYKALYGDLYYDKYCYDP